MIQISFDFNNLIIGKTYKGVAIDKFKEKTGLPINPCGLFIHTEMAFLAASPDGCIYKDGKRILVEVKCPYQGRNKMITPGESFQFLEITADGSVKLKHSHNYFYQVMGQMVVTRSKLCYFFVYTHDDFLIEEIEF